ncbi:MAG: hypothetical protein COU07_02835 [Candidatus Harrisonbacteria bacterium CG10_big_fil_rev_8_21_14_0_10_40_38]|uniref:DoxX family protein n=1 Tax=Candidatus Harrisonbacteria bacterium CG10_big_fil_rev_8_21_14_0_10_40_38 TaxID=1974583 RepID=A0A2H0URW8_9BACT|nr:MAG: hypothetical protein COU07_02835 [Candidatus Harrisonbacteria bacterium CG10_big_fil_rev_8_21_14_0_10_40_38]
MIAGMTKKPSANVWRVFSFTCDKIKHMIKSPKVKKSVFWITQGIVIAVFLMEGITKIFGLDFQIQNFIRWGYPSWFVYIIGFIETLSAILLLTKYRNIAVTSLLTVMAGAIFTHVSNGEPQMMGLAILMILFLIISSRIKRAAQ